MNWLHDLPLKRKLTLVILLTCSSVLLLACGVLATFQVFNFRQNMVHDTTACWRMCWPENTRAALAFQDDKAAQQTLRALESRTQCFGGLPLHHRRQPVCHLRPRGNQSGLSTQTGR